MSGRTAATSSYVAPRRVSGPGRRLVTNTSHVAARRSRMSRPRGSLRSIAMLRLLRSRLSEIPERYGCGPGPIARLVSPVADSMVMTSAPRSPRIWVAIGPITTEVRSSTRTPPRAPVVRSSSGTRGLDHPGQGRPVGQRRAGRSDERGAPAVDLADVTLEQPGGQLEGDGVVEAVLLAGDGQVGKDLGQAGAVVHVEGGHEPTSSSTGCGHSQ